MRKLVLLAAAVPLLFAPAALATDGNAAKEKSVCRVPDVDLAYDARTFSALVSLSATGCASREHTIFTVGAVITRVDNSADGRDVTERSMTCGPFRSAAGRANEEPPAQYFCDLGLTLPHPEVETARYTVDVTYPAAPGDDERVRRLHLGRRDGRPWSLQLAEHRNAHMEGMEPWNCW